MIARFSRDSRSRAPDSPHRFFETGEHVGLAPARCGRRSSVDEEEPMGVQLKVVHAVVVMLAACNDGVRPADLSVPLELRADVARDRSGADAPKGDLTQTRERAADLPRDVRPTPDLSADAGSTYVKNPISAADAAKLCALISACVKQSASDCLTGLYSKTGAVGSPYFPCLLQAKKGCGSMMDCYGAEVFTSTTCTDADTKCVGSFAHNCITSVDLQTRLDCSKVPGTTCTLLTASGATQAACSTGAACTTPPYYTCSGSTSLYCFGGKQMVLGDCQAGQALPCRDGQCAGPGEPCVKDTSVCEGTDTIAFCVAGYRLRLKCSALGPGFACVAAGKTGARCEQGKACDPDAAKGTETCSGTKLTVCNGGQPTQVDCAALGFTGCSGGFCVP
jgi:hypothetical protein